MRACLTHSVDVLPVVCSADGSDEDRDELADFQTVRPSRSLTTPSKALSDPSLSPMPQRKCGRLRTSSSVISGVSRVSKPWLPSPRFGSHPFAPGNAYGSESTSEMSCGAPAGSAGNSRRPSRLIDPSELQGLVRVSVGQLAADERALRKRRIGSYEYSDSDSNTGSPRAPERRKKTAHVAYLAEHEQTARKQSLANTLHLIEAGPRQIFLTWLLSIAIALATALECAGILMLSGVIQAWRLRVVQAIINRGDSPIVAFIFLLGYALPVNVAASMLVVFLSSSASGSGIPELKAFLNGNGISELFSVKTLAARSIGLVLVTSTGLFAGTEGPAAHIGAITAHTFARYSFKYGAERGWLPPMGHRTACEFVAQGCAIGVASAFGAPVGGILFSLEEATSFWSKSITWRSFVGCTVAVATAKAANAGFRGLPVAGFLEFPDVDADFDFWEMLPFAITAVCTGVLGAVFTCLSECLILARSGFYSRRGRRRVRVYKIAEVSLVTLITISVIFWVPLANGCRPLIQDAAQDQGEWYVGSFRPTVCREGEYSDLGNLLLTRNEVTIKALFTASFQGGAELRTAQLILAAFLICSLTLLTQGTAVPAGLFIPNILMGACLGRATGQIVSGLVDVPVHAGVYSIIGAVGMLAGYSRMTVSLAMITLEITQSMKLLLPVTMAILVSKGIADFLKPESVYDLGVVHHPLGRITLLRAELDEEDLPLLKLLTAHDACSVLVQTLKCEETPEHIMASLMKTSFSGFPLVGCSGANEVVGLILRDRLLQALKERQQGPEGEQHPRGQLINLMPYADKTPEVKHWNTPLVRTFRHFSAAGLRHLCLVDEAHVLVGILTRSDLAPLCHPKTRSRAAYDMLLRKQDALHRPEAGGDADTEDESGSSTSDAGASEYASSSGTSPLGTRMQRGNTWWLG